MFPLDFPIQMAIEMFSMEISVRDMEYVKISGEDKRQLSASRTIVGALDPGRSRSIERIFGESVGDGDIGVYTVETLYIDDEYSLDDSNPNRLQSFVFYSGVYYRVAQSADWQGHTGTWVYLCKRHVAQDSL